MEKRDYEKRVVVYKKIHKINSKDFQKFVKIVSPKPKEKILDCMSGYGEAGKSLLDKKNNIDLYFLDYSDLQIKRAKESFPKISKDKFIVSSVIKTPFEKEFFDKIIIKMGLHEVGKKNLPRLFKEISRILKPNGKFIIWNMMLDEKNKTSFRKIFKKKDELANFKELVKNRYFPTEEELVKFAKKYFSKINKSFSGNLVFATKVRLDSEFKGSLDKLKELNSFIRKTFPENIKKEFKFKDNKEDIEFNVNNNIWVLEK